MAEPTRIQRVGAGCGVQGCLFSAVAIFVLLLVGMLVIAFFRFREPPQGAPRPLSAGPPAIVLEGRGEADA